MIVNILKTRYSLEAEGTHCVLLVGTRVTHVQNLLAMVGEVSRTLNASHRRREEKRRKEHLGQAGLVIRPRSLLFHQVEAPYWYY